MAVLCPVGKKYLSAKQFTFRVYSFWSQLPSQFVNNGIEWCKAWVMQGIMTWKSFSDVKMVFLSFHVNCEGQTFGECEHKGHGKDRTKKCGTLTSPKQERLSASGPRSYPCSSRGGKGLCLWQRWQQRRQLYNLHNQSRGLKTQNDNVQTDVPMDTHAAVLHVFEDPVIFSDPVRKQKKTCAFGSHCIFALFHSLFNLSWKQFHSSVCWRDPEKMSQRIKNLTLIGGGGFCLLFYITLLQSASPSKQI